MYINENDACGLFLSMPNILKELCTILYPYIIVIGTIKNFTSARCFLASLIIYTYGIYLIVTLYLFYYNNSP